MSHSLPGRGRSAAALALCAAAYLYVFPHYPGINNPNENVRFYMTAAIVEHGTYQIDDLRRRWGWVNDAGIREGHYYSTKAPGTSMLGVPGYAAYRLVAGEEVDRGTALWVCRVTATVIPTLIWLLFLYRWLGERTRFPLLRDAAFLAIALGSCIYGYGLLFASHTPSAACGFGAFMLLYGGRHRGHLGVGGAFLAGLLTGGVTFFEYPGLVASVVLTLYALAALRPWRRLLPFLVGGLIPTLVMMHFQWKAFGGPFTPGHTMVESSTFREQVGQGFYGVVAFQPEAALALLKSLRVGLFSLSPFLAFAAIGFVRLIGRPGERADALAALAVIVCTFFAISCLNNWSGGWAIGPRYLVVTLPFLAWGALAGFDWVASVAPRTSFALALGSATAGLVASGIPSAYYPHLPPPIEHPLPQLFAVLIDHGYAPSNAGNLLGWYGTASMLPMLLLGVGAVVWASGPLPWKRRVLVLTASALVAWLALLPQLEAPPPDPAAARSVASITHHWYPEGHDRRTRLEQAIESSDRVWPVSYFRLADFYFAEGRWNDGRAMVKLGYVAVQRGSIIKGDSTGD